MLEKPDSTDSIEDVSDQVIVLSNSDEDCVVCPENDSSALYECSICLGSKKLYAMISIKCGHCFCDNCLQSTIKNKKCAICNQHFEEDDKRKIFLKEKK